MSTDPCIDIIAQAIKTTCSGYVENTQDVCECRVCDCRRAFANQAGHHTHIYEEIARAVRSQIARELELDLPTILANEAKNAYGWLSDGHKCVRIDEPDRVSYCGDGSIDLHHIASIAAVCITKL
ncbi:hypothetical protein [Changpingibacter yushuensis]|uniref:hypothetical protein n=1 Tax=Changpingibacter yushuensis TaxID=2758440 RepID=UPI0015F452D9|nr:hypothetical protein [Changpingibacter yushuensis]